MSPSAPPDDALTLERQVSFALSRAARHIVAIYRPLLAELNLTHPQYLVMVALWQHGPLPVRRLRDLLQLDSGTLSPLLTRLESAGQVRRRRDKADSRSVIVVLTAQGDALRTRARSVLPAVLDDLGMPAGELEHLHSVLAGVIAARSTQVV
ncbi:putative transcriptional regulator, MarR family protein [Actinoplanes italicus]|uniref:MarR family transcriptional regulator n=1 Tax=Actinoplanes italicus TaxID=113567 RepID=A0A2T0K794_9ACTN|nr:MarR family transcriptional regulator [Actinoplanes italicus]PRX18869.1 MarR family transcriptional regulator [Actinoplanes italicus]GIE32554.1 putative transcriptional regulator, MarR family protein [Actinoplanes italicus]